MTNDLFRLCGGLLRFGGMLTLLLLGACFASCSRPSPSEAVQAFKREDLEIEARQVSRKELQRIIDISGTLLPNEEVVVSSEVEGPVEKVLVDLGDRVKRGVNKVFVVENGKIRERVIKLGDRFGDDVEVLEGLKGGEVVTSSELSRLENDLPVRIK